MPLSEKQALFVREYLVDANATQAAIRAGYSEKTAEQQGSRLLRNVQVAKAISEAQERRATRLEVKQDDVLRTLLRILNTDIGQAFDDNGVLLPIKDMPEDVRKSISSIEFDELYEGGGRDRFAIGQTKKLKFWSKDKALELAMRHLGLLNDKLKVEAAVTLEDLVTASYRPEKP